MADNKKYYYLKLKENFFDMDNIVLLESMTDGILYSNILLKLYLKSLKHEGLLMLTEKIPFTPQMIATITRHQVGIVEKALEIFLELDLIAVYDSGVYYMNDIELFVGKSSTEGERKKRARLEKQRLLEGAGQVSTSEVDKRPPELEIEKEIEIEKKKEKELDTDIKTTHHPITRVSKEQFKNDQTRQSNKIVAVIDEPSGVEPTEAEPTVPRGSHSNILLSDKDYMELVAVYKKSIVDLSIENMSTYIYSHNKSYEDYKQRLKLWIDEDIARGKFNAH